MRLASITLPIPDDTGRPIDAPFGKKYNAMQVGHRTIVNALTEGFTRIEGQGCWMGDTETVYRYEFACEDNEQGQSDLRALAFRVKVLTDEQSIMVVHANGEVEFI